MKRRTGVVSSSPTRAPKGYAFDVHGRHDDRSTGTKLDRPGLQAALDLARQGRIDQLLVYRIDRLSREVRQLAQLAEEREARERRPAPTADLVLTFDL